MNKITTLGEVYDQVGSMSKSCKDSMVNKNDVSFESLNALTISGERKPVAVTAQKLIANRLNIPYPYLKRCPVDIQAQNLNHWIKKERNDALFFRFDADTVRAVFTPKYKPVDNIPVIKRILSLGYSADAEVSCSLDKDFMSLSIMNDSNSFDIDGDEFRPGISVSNSEVGLSSVSIAAFIYRLVCTNGLIQKNKNGSSFRHVSSRILDEIPNIIKSTSMDLIGQQNQLRLSLKSRVNDHEASFESFNRRFQISKDEKKAVEWAWPYEAGTSMFNIINTYTKAAQYKELPASSSHKLEKTGGSILAMVS